MRRILALSFVLVLLPYTQSYAQQMLCYNSRDEALKKLYEGYGESVTWRGISSVGNIMLELLVNKETGTWTLLTVNTEGKTCLRAGGDGSRTLKISPREDKLLSY